MRQARALRRYRTAQMHATNEEQPRACHRLETAIQLLVTVVLPEQSTGSSTARSGKESGPGCSLKKMRKCFVRCVLNIYNAVSQCKSRRWVSQPCTLFRRDKVKKHADSEMHKGSEQQEAIAAIPSVYAQFSINNYFAIIVRRRKNENMREEPWKNVYSHYIPPSPPFISFCVKHCQYLEQLHCVFQEQTSMRLCQGDDHAKLSR